MRKQLKNIFIVVFVFLSGIIVSQTISLTRTRQQLLQAKTLTEILPDVPSDWDSLATNITGKCKGKLVSADVGTNVISQGTGELLRTADKNTKLYINIRYGTSAATSKKKPTKNYVVKIVG